MNMIEIIRCKRDGGELSGAQIREWIAGCTSGEIPDYQSAALLMAGRLNGFTHQETIEMVWAMVESGARLDLSDVEGVKVDKHSTGGVGDKTSLVAMPIAAACGLKVAKMSGRGLGHTGGTLDKLESIPGLCVGLDIQRFKQQVRECGIAIVSQSGELAPADKKLYALRDVTATVDSIPLIAASIMSKKIATGADVLVLDVKYGSGALIHEQERCLELARTMVELAQATGVKCAALLTSMEQPLGFAVGNALEVREALDVLEGGGPGDLREEAVLIAAEQLLLAGWTADEQTAKRQAEQALNSGAAREKFAQMVRAQGGTDDLSRLPQAAARVEYCARTSGYISSFDAARVGEAAMLLGAGRLKKEDAIDPAVGIVFTAKSGAHVQAGQTVAVLHCNDQANLPLVQHMMDQAVLITPQSVPLPPLIAQIIR